MQTTQRLVRYFGRALGLCAGLGLIAVFAGCESTTNYSKRSYQGPIPIHDQRYVDAWR